jgi:UDPglucose 6-dehydrogenase
MALALSSCGHEVTGHDISSWPYDVLTGKAPVPREQGLSACVDWWRDHQPDGRTKRGGSFTLGGLTAAVDGADLVFVAVQTPHDREFDGTTPMGEGYADFDYGPLTKACNAILDVMASQPDRRHSLVVVSTTAPGTLDRLFATLPANVSLAYNPSFISLGTVIPDFLVPELVLVGTASPDLALKLEEFYQSNMPPAWNSARFRSMPVAAAEMTKLACNNYQTLKITWANEIAALCAALEINVDHVLDTLAIADQKIGAPRMRAGLGDGGPCRVRDAVVLSKFTSDANMASDGLFGDLLWRREDQAFRLVQVIQGYADYHGLEIRVLGKAYKPQSDRTDGSPALLLAGLLGGGTSVPVWDPYVDEGPAPSFEEPRLFVLATDHEKFWSLPFPPGSVVFDLWGSIEKVPDGVTLIRYARREAGQSP